MINRWDREKDITPALIDECCKQLFKNWNELPDNEQIHHRADVLWILRKVMQ